MTPLWRNGFLPSAIFGCVMALYFMIGGCGRYYPAATLPQQEQKTPQQTAKPTQPVKPAQPAVPQKPKTIKPGSASTATGSLKSVTGSYMGYPALQQLMERMTRKGYRREELARIFSGIVRDENILAKVRSPAEAKPWRAYRPIFLTEERIRAGLGFWRIHQKTLQRAYQKYGVEPEYIVAIIGVETFYGRHLGKHNVLRSLTTLAMDFPPRAPFYTGELEHFLQLIREESIQRPQGIKGSYAGAMGLGQFISSSYRNYAVDFNSDGRRDLWHPVDAIGSVASYFSRHGWKKGQDVTVPARVTGSRYAKIAHTKAIKPLYSLKQLGQFGVLPRERLNSTRVDLLKLQGASGDEYWVTGDNFYTITRYNHSPKYAMAVYQLAQEIKRRKNGR